MPRLPWRRMPSGGRGEGNFSPSRARAAFVFAVAVMQPANRASGSPTA